MRMYIYTYVQVVPPAAGGTLCLPSSCLLDPSLPSYWHLDIGPLEAAAPLHLLVQTTAHTHTQSWPGLPQYHSCPTILSPIGTHRCYHSLGDPLPLSCQALAFLTPPPAARFCVHPLYSVSAVILHWSSAMSYLFSQGSLLIHLLVFLRARIHWFCT